MAETAQNIAMEKIVYCKPVNRYIQINIPQVTPTTESGLVLPEDYNPKTERHIVASVVSWAPDVRFAEDLKEGTQIIVDSAMIEEINIKESQLNVIQDNYIIAILVE